jgi:putative flippase GtrA
LEAILRLLRSALGGLLATLADLGALTLLVQGFGVSPRVASVPALLAGNLVMFFAQKKVAFRSSGGSVRRELVRFALVQSGGFLLTALLYDLALALIPGAAGAYVLTRLVVTNLVWLGYSFPLWHWVFPTRDAGRAPPPR